MKLAEPIELIIPGQPICPKNTQLHFKTIKGIVNRRNNPHYINIERTKDHIRDLYNKAPIKGAVNLIMKFYVYPLDGVNHEPLLRHHVFKTFQPHSTFPSIINLAHMAAHILTGIVILSENQIASVQCIKINSLKPRTALIIQSIVPSDDQDNMNNTLNIPNLS